MKGVEDEDEETVIQLGRKGEDKGTSFKDWGYAELKMGYRS